jgi:hypothetical protein
MKTKVTVAEFQKRVETEKAYLIYMDRMKDYEAERKARDTVNQKYEIA